MAIEEHPIHDVLWIPIERVQANDYNPNAVAPREMRLLYTSIKADGYTQPVVTVYDPEIDKYVIVDGFHRYTVMLRNEDVRESTGGLLPIVVLEKSAAERIAATVRHNRARGKHSVAGMSNLVLRMLQEGRSDVDICDELGLEAQELLRLKHITGFSALIAQHELSQAWEVDNQVKARAAYRAEHPDEAMPV